MPHLTVEYSANLEEDVEIAAFCAEMRDAMLATGIFPLAGIRVRAFPCRTYVIADGDPRYAYVNMICRMGAGRDTDTRLAAAEAIYAAAEGHLKARIGDRPAGALARPRRVAPAHLAQALQHHPRRGQGTDIMSGSTGGGTAGATAGHADNLARAHGYLARFRDAGIVNRIAGELVPAASGATFATRSPVDGAVLAQVARGDAEDVDRAARAAKAAFPAWRDLPAAERRAILHRIADAIEARAEEIAFCECLDTGQALRFMSKAALRGAENFRFFADRAPAARDGQALPSPTLMNVTTRVPIGPVGIITPWNTPFMLSTWKIAPALAAGCTVVHKPAELAPVTATILHEIAEEAGLPPGVWNVVNGMGEEAGRALTEHTDIKAIAFVGESATGSAIMAQGAPTLKRVHFELGGKNPVIVFDDADLDRALDATVFMIYSLNGERCTSSSRLLVQSTVHDTFTARLAERVRAIRVGHPLDPDTELGPLIAPEHAAKICRYVDIARDEGATVAVGGRPIDGPGSYVQPTLFTDARPDMAVAQDEIFGPVLTVIPFDTEDRALEIANGVRYGLTAYVWTNDVTRAFRVSDRLEAGMIWVNSENVRHLPTPFGGVKASGIGRDGGDWSFEFYMETKHIGFATGRHRIPRLGATIAP